MIHTHSYKGIVWLDLESPIDDEIKSLIKRYELHPLIEEEFGVNSALSTKTELYNDHILVSLTLPIKKKLKNGGYDVLKGRIIFIIGKNFLITSRTDTIPQLEYFGKVFDTNSTLNKDGKIEHAGYLFYYMIKKIYSGLLNDLRNINDSISGIRNKVYKNQNRNSVEIISLLSHELIDIRQTTKLHDNVWKKIEEDNIFNKDFIPYIEDLHNEFILVKEQITNTQEFLQDLRLTNDSFLLAKNTKIGKTAIMMAISFLPVMLMTMIFIIPENSNHFFNSLYGLPVVLCISIICSTIIWYFLRNKKII